MSLGKLSLLLPLGLIVITSAANCQTPAPTSVYSRTPTPPSADDAYSPQLRDELKALRAAALSSDYA